MTLRQILGTSLGSLLLGCIPEPTSANDMAKVSDLSAKPEALDSTCQGLMRSLDRCTTPVDGDDETWVCDVDPKDIVGCMRLCNNSSWPCSTSNVVPVLGGEFFQTSSTVPGRWPKVSIIPGVAGTLSASGISLHPNDEQRSKVSTLIRGELSPSKELNHFTLYQFTKHRPCEYSLVVASGEVSLSNGANGTPSCDPIVLTARSLSFEKCDRDAMPTKVRQNNSAISLRWEWVLSKENPPTCK